MSEAGVKQRLMGIWDRFTSRVVGNGNGAHQNGHPTGSSRLRHLWGQIWQREPVGGVDGYRRLTYQLHHGLPRGDAPRSILVTTPKPSDVSASASMELARVMAEELQRPVLLVEASADLELSGMLDGPPAQGLTDLISDPSLSLDDLAIPTSHENVAYLPRGTVSQGPALASPEVTRLLGCMGERFDFMVISGGGVLANGLALWLAGYVGQTLLLVSEGHTHMDEIDAAQSTLRLCRAGNITVVLTERSSAVP